MKRTRDRLQTLQYLKSISFNPVQFKNTIWTIAGMREDKKIDRSIKGLKYKVCVKLLHAQVEYL